MTITLPSGQTLTIMYQFSFGEMGITCALLLLCALFALRFAYDVVFQLWMGRRRG